MSNANLVCPNCEQNHGWDVNECIKNEEITVKTGWFKSEKQKRTVRYQCQDSLRCRRCKKVWIRMILDGFQFKYF